MTEEHKILIEQIIEKMKSEGDGILSKSEFTDLFENKDQSLSIGGLMIDNLKLVERVHSGTGSTQRYRLSKEGWAFTNFEELKKQELKQELKYNIELDNLTTNTRLNKWLLKTKWLPLILSIVAILISLYFNIQDKNKQAELELKIKDSEKSIDTLKIDNMNLKKRILNLELKKTGNRDLGQ